MTKKTLTAIPDINPESVTDAADSGAVDSLEAPQPPEPSTPISVSQQIINYAALVSNIRSTFKLSEGGIIKLFELALNERLTLIQWGLAGRRATTTEEPDGNETSGS